MNAVDTSFDKYLPIVIGGSMFLLALFTLCVAGLIFGTLTIKMKHRQKRVRHFYSPSSNFASTSNFKGLLNQFCWVLLVIQHLRVFRTVKLHSMCVCLYVCVYEHRCDGGMSYFMIPYTKTISVHFWSIQINWSLILVKLYRRNNFNFLPMNWYFQAV